MTEVPDFELLRSERNKIMLETLRAFCEQRGWVVSKAQTTFDPNACYCACPSGPCEHDFKDWREFEDGCGGETVCQRCGMGAMSHSMRVAE